LQLRSTIAVPQPGQIRCAATMSCACAHAGSGESSVDPFPASGGESGRLFTAGAKPGRESADDLPWTKVGCEEISAAGPVRCPLIAKLRRKRGPRTYHGPGRGSTLRRNA
jgi:hypothetical protein